MRKFFLRSIPVFALILLTACARPPVRPEPQAGATVEPALASRFMVRAWQTPPAFKEVRIAHIIGDTLYIAGTPRGLTAIDTTTGLTKWVHIGKYPLSAAPTLQDKLLVFPEGGRVVTIDAQNGVEVSRTKTRLGIASQVFATENSWVFSAGSDNVYGMVPGTSIKAWRYTMDEAPVSTTWDQEDLAYFLTYNGTLYAVSVSTRSPAWQYSFRKPLCSNIALGGDLMFIGNQDYYMYALSRLTGVEQWRVPVSAPALDAPVAAHGRVYVMTADRVLHAIDIATQKEVWQVPNAGRVLTATPERVYYLHRNLTNGMNEIIVANSADGARLAISTAVKYNLFKAAPESGVIFAIGPRGDVLAISDRDVAEAKEKAKVEQP